MAQIRQEALRIWRGMCFISLVGVVPVCWWKPAEIRRYPKGRMKLIWHWQRKNSAYNNTSWMSLRPKFVHCQIHQENSVAANSRPYPCIPCESQITFKTLRLCKYQITDAYIAVELISMALATSSYDKLCCFKPARHAHWASVDKRSMNIKTRVQVDWQSWTGHSFCGASPLIVPMCSRSLLFAPQWNLSIQMDHNIF